MSYAITQNLIPGLPHIPYEHGIGAYEGVVNHSTATPNATDEAIRNYEANHWKDAFVQFAVDWDSITQLADYNYSAYGAGPNANRKFVHIELCETSDPNLFKQSYDRYVWLTAWLLSRKNLGVTDAGTLWSHAEVTKFLGGTTHSDPIAYFASHGLSWAQHVVNVAAKYLEIVGGPVQSKPVASSGGYRTLNVGDLVTVAGFATQYADGKTIAQFVKGSQHRIVQVKSWVRSNSSKAYLLADIMGWVLEQDIVEAKGQQPAPAPVTVAKPSGIKAVGTIKIVGVSKAAIVMDRPDRNNSNNLGTLPLGTKIAISGSVPGYWEIIYNGRRAYVTAKFGVRV